MRQLKQLLLNRKLRRALGLAIIVVTALVFARFVIKHPDYLRTLTTMDPWVVPAILVLNAGVLLAVVYIFNLLTQMCGKRMALREQFLLSSYASIANFFGPLQSGPGVRAVYLKAKHQIRMRDFLAASLIYYAMFAAISALFLLSAVANWWQMLLGVAIFTVVANRLVRYVWQRQQAKGSRLRLILKARTMALLSAATFVQVCIVTAYYFVELRAVDAQISLHQAVVYTGAANFSLFVSLTPDGIGIREGFLVLSQDLHHISTEVILAANLVDRAVYLLFLGLLFLLVLALHAKDKLGIKDSAK